MKKNTTTLLAAASVTTEGQDHDTTSYALEPTCTIDVAHAMGSREKDSSKDDYDTPITIPDFDNANVTRESTEASVGGAHRGISSMAFALAKKVEDEETPRSLTPRILQFQDSHSSRGLTRSTSKERTVEARNKEPPDLVSGVNAWSCTSDDETCHGCTN